MHSYEKRATQVKATDFDGSDNEVYEQSEESDEEYRDDLSISGSDDQEDEAERERQFFGDENYTLLSRIPEEEVMSQTM
jgi:hypothetical protein